MAVSAVGNAQAQNTGGLSGTVVSMQLRPQRVVAGAKVLAHSGAVETSTTTDKRGNFIFLSLPPGLVQVQVLAPGYVPLDFAACVQADVIRTLPIKLSPGGSLPQLNEMVRYNNGLRRRPDPGITSGVHSIGEC